MKITVAELIEQLQDLDQGAEVRLATQPSWPFECSIVEPQEYFGEEGEVIVYIGEGAQLGYLPRQAADDVWG